MKRPTLILALALLAGFSGLLASCTREPVRIGFIAGTAGKYADLGARGRNGALLAVEQRNARGGIHGRQIELIVRDDKQDAQEAQKAFAELSNEKAVAVIGPMTSSMATAIVPEANRRNILLMGGTITTSALSGKDDLFFRVMSDTRRHAEKSARYHLEKLGLRRIAALIDTANREHTEDWIKHYRKTLEAHGGQLIDLIAVDLRQERNYAMLAESLLAQEPELVVLGCNTLDSAMLAQNIRKQGSRVILAGTAWSATERIIELGGQAVEGMYLEQYIDRDSQAKPYLDFLDAYRKRFMQEPGFAGTIGFEAAKVLLDTMEKAPDLKTENLKKTILVTRRFSGLQGPLVFDAFGEVDRSTYLTLIKDGRFVAAPR